MSNIILTDPKISRKHPYTINFKYISVMNDKYLKCKYTGPDFSGDNLEMFLSNAEIEDIKKQMNKIFGYGPFDIRKVEKIMKESNPNEVPSISIEARI